MTVSYRFRVLAARVPSRPKHSQVEERTIVQLQLQRRHFRRRNSRIAPVTDEKARAIANRWFAICSAVNQRPACMRHDVGFKLSRAS